MANTRMDYYKVLEIPRDAKPDEIKAAYKKMVSLPVPYFILSTTLFLFSRL